MAPVTPRSTPSSTAPGDYRQARGAVQWISDKTPEQVIREMRDGEPRTSEATACERCGDETSGNRLVHYSDPWSTPEQTYDLCSECVLSFGRWLIRVPS